MRLRSHVKDAASTRNNTPLKGYQKTSQKDKNRQNALDKSRVKSPMLNTKPNSTSNSEFTIIFNYMGQGDCTMIKCPDGEVIVIDCGSEKHYPIKEVQRQNIMLRNLLDTKNSVKALIITHSDADHCNRLRSLFKPGDNNSLIPIEKTIVSNFNKYGHDEQQYIDWLTVYKGEQANFFWSQNNYTGQIKNEDYLQNKDTSGDFFSCQGKINAVFIREKDNKFEQKVIQFAPDNLTEFSETILLNETQKRLYVHRSLPSTTKNWSVSIIAGNVIKREGDDGQPPNNCSLVTLIEYESNKIIISGDATKSTEDFLIANQKELIENANLIQAGHHGSLTSSTQAYVDTVKPKQVVVSCGPREYGFGMPRKTVLDRWIKQMQEQNQGLSQAEREKLKGVSVAWVTNNNNILTELKKIFENINEVTEGYEKTQAIWQKWVNDGQAKFEEDFHTLGEAVSKEYQGLTNLDLTKKVDENQYFFPNNMIALRTNDERIAYFCFKNEYNPFITAVYGDIEYIMNDEKVYLKSTTGGSYI